MHLLNMINSYQNNINFSGYKTNFSKQFEEFLRCDNPSREQKEVLKQEFANVISKRSNDKHKLGEGKFHNTYKIDDYYVFRVDKDEKPYIDTPIKRKHVKYDGFKGFKSYFGYIVARFGDFEIFKNALGSSKKSVNAGIPFDLSSRYYNMLENGILPDRKLMKNITKYYNETYLPTFSKLPQRAYDNLVKDFVSLNKSATKESFDLIDSYDCNNPNNFVQVGKSIRIVDDLSTKFSESNISDVTHVFLRNYAAKETSQSKKMKREIFNKCMIAAMKHDFTKGSIRLEKTLQFVGIKEPIEDFAQNINDISMLPKRKRVPMLKEYLNSI